MAKAKVNLARNPVNTRSLYWAKRTFGYGVRGETERMLDRGECFLLEDLPNDRLLVSLGYAGELAEDTDTYPCRECGRVFLEQRMRDQHGKDRHETADYMPPPAPVRDPRETDDEFQRRTDAWSLQAGAMADAADGKRAKHEDTVAPLNLENTTASREA